MRLDKFLKLSRIIKRRTIAKDISEIGLVKVNGKIAKPSTDIKVDDELELALGERTLKVKVENLLTTANKKNASSMFSIISDTSNI